MRDEEVGGEWKRWGEQGRGEMEKGGWERREDYCSSLSRHKECDADG